jgi:hypothetical protein
MQLFAGTREAAALYGGLKDPEMPLAENARLTRTRALTGRAS